MAAPPSDEHPRTDVAIVGMGCRFPGGADSPSAFWDLLRGGTDAVTEVPPDRFDLERLFDPDPAAPGKIYTRWGGFIDPIDTFDAEFFGIAPREARRMDPQQRVLLEVVWEALEDGGQVPERLAGSRTGVFVGISTRDYVDIQVLPHHPDRIDAHVNAGTAGSIAANRISYLLDLQGPSLAIDTACSSSLTALHLGCRSLAAGESELAIVGGVGILLAPEVTVGFCKASMLSPDGRCRAFDAGANGYVRSEGAGVVVLKALPEAISDGDPIHAVILGSAVNQDGRTTGLSLPSAPAQQAMLDQALRNAGVSATEIDYVEAHGTGTPAGDPIEAEAIGTVLAGDRREDEPCIIGSVKTNVGHLEAAAGMAGLLKTALALEHRQIPPNLHLERPNPAIPFDQLRLRVPTELEAWPAGGTRPVAGVNSFGFGGANAHAVLTTAPDRDAVAGSADRPGSHVVTLSARGDGALRDLARRHRQRLESGAEPSLSDLAYTTSVRRSHHADRLAVVARSHEDLRGCLDAFLDDEAHPSLVVGRAPSNRQPRLAFVLTGMGPQWWGMGRGLLDREPVFGDTLRRVDEVLRPIAGWSLSERLAADAEASRVGEADVAHVANLAIQVGLCELWREWGVVPDAVVGHSSGEMGAACVAGALSLEDAVELAYHRGRLQHRTTGTGRMLAATMSLEEAQDLVATHEHTVSLAAVNAPGSVTLSGDETVLRDIAERLEAQQRFARLLPVRVPYHGPQMDTIREEFLAECRHLIPRPAHIPLVSTVTGAGVDGPELDAAYWWRNVRQPVRFQAAVEELLGQGTELFVEVGPHPVLAAAIRATFAENGVAGTVLPSLRREDDEQEVLLRTLAELHVRGRTVDWSALAPGGTCVSLPSYPWQRQRHWFDQDEEGSVQPAGAVGVETGHPLLGRRLPTARPTWETRLDAHGTEYLDAHVVQDAPLFPAAGYIELALAAGRELWGERPVRIENLQLRKLLFLQRPRGAVVQVAHDPEHGTLEVHSDATGDAASWTLHTSAKLATDVLDDHTDLAELRSRCTTPFAVQEHYAILENGGYGFGPEFRTLREIWLGPDGDALARVGFPSDSVLPVTGYRVHPSLLDAAIQLFGAISTREAGVRAGAPFFPVSIERLRFHRPPGAGGWAYVAVRDRDEGRIERDAWLFDEAGEVAITIEGLQLQLLDEPSAPEDGSIDDWLYELRWEEPSDATGGATAGRGGTSTRAAASTGAPSPLRPIAEITAAAEARTDRPEDTPDVARYLDPVEPTLDRLAQDFTLLALAELGWTTSGELDPSRDEAATALGVVPSHQRVFGELLDMVGRSQPIGAASLPHDPDVLHARVDELVTAQPQYAAEAELLRRGGSHLAEVLRGEVDARELLLSGESLALLARFYDSSPPCRSYHELLADAVDAAVDGADGPGPLRVLELGAGTGAATATLLARLPAEVEYTFTDVSSLFLADAEQRFGDRPGVRFATLDIEADPEAQGFDVHGYDLVVAANVLHVTEDLDRTLGHVRRLLREGGLLAVLELTARFGRPLGWLNLVFGLLEGWWRATDDHRGRRGPVLDAHRWRELLTDQGFSPVSSPFGGTVDEHTLQTVVLGRAPAPVEASASATGEGPATVPGEAPARARATAEGDTEARRWVILADAVGVARAVGDRLRDEGDECIHVRPGAEYRRHQDGSVSLPPTDSGAYRRLWSELGADEERVTVLHLWSLDAPEPDELDADGVMAAQQLGCGSVLALTQMIVELEAPVPELWLVTAAGQPVDGDHGDNVVTSTLWGLGRVLMSEQGDTRFRLLDLDPGGPAEQVDGIVTELRRDGPDEEVALRGDRRLVRRLRHLSLAERARRDQVRQRSPLTDSFRLEVGSPGTIESLLLREPREPDPDPGPGELVIRVMASGVNFRDVLQTLDMLPAAAYQYDPDPDGLGIECAGVVVACGHGADRFQPGDAVIALAAAAHGSRVVAREDLTVAKPEALPFEHAASVLNAFVTAEYALHHVARIRPGERVLIHSASGAVGLAAIQLCRQVGAEILATAGTPEKRRHLATLGIEHVMDSRSLAFADEVLDATDGEGVDVVLNSLTGEATAKGLSVLRRYGRFVELGKRDIFEDAKVGLLPFQRNLSFHAVDLIQLALDRPQQALELLEHVVARIADGDLEPVPVTTFDLADAEDAFRLMAQARHIGKVVLTVQEPHYTVHAPAGAPVFRRDATYLITGGLGGFALAVARWMAEAGAGDLVLMSRSGLPREDPGALEALQGSPARITVLRGDVAREDDVAAVLAHIRERLPPLRGVIHAAMVLDDDALVRLDQERFAAVLAPKVAGAWNLHRSTREDDLDLFVSFSSVAAVIGHPMQANYAAANVFLDVLAAHRRARGLPGLTIGWGTIDGVGYVSRHRELAQYLDRGGFQGMSPEQAFETLDRLLRYDVDHVVAARMDWGRWAEVNPLAGATRRFQGLVGAGTTASERTTQDGAATTLERLRQVAAVERDAVVIDYLREKVGRVLGTDPDRLDVERPLTELGFDSLMAVELTTAFTSDLGARVPVVEVLQGLSSAELVGKILDQLVLDEPAHQPADPDPRDPGQFGPDEQDLDRLGPDERDLERFDPDERDLDRFDPEQLAPGSIHSEQQPASEQEVAEQRTGLHLAEGPHAGEDPPEAGAEHPLSSEQLRFWFLDRSDPGTPTSNLPAAARLRGHLDVEALRTALSEVLRRHEVLRAVVRDADGEPVQRFLPPREPELPVVDLGDAAAPEDTELGRVLACEIREPFDLRRGPLTRLTLLRLGPTDHVLLLVVHHLVGDAWSMNMLVREIAALYEAETQGRSLSLPAPSFGYPDYVREQRNRVAETGEAQLAYWRRKLAGASGRLRLPRPTSQAPGPDDPPASHRAFELEEELTHRLRAFCEREGVTLFMALLAAFQALLHRYCGDEDICVGTAVSTRTQPGAEAAAGCFLNTLVLRNDLSGAPGFRELLQQVRASTLEAVEHQDVPFDRVVAAVQPERGPGSPLFDAMLVLHDTQPPELELSGLELRPLRVEGVPIVPLMLIVDVGDQLGGMLMFDSERVDATTAQGMLDHLRILLESVVRDPDQPIATLPLVTADEARRLLAWGTGPVLGDGESSCMHELVAAQVKRSPGALAVVAGSTRLTYRELDEQANQLAHHLRALGTTTGDVVGSCLDRSAEAVVAALGILKAGGAYLPLAPSDPPARLRGMLEGADVAAVITTSGWRASSVDLDLPTVLLDADRERIADHPTNAPAVRTTADDLAYVLHTSGSSGDPKGVMVPHRAICNQSRWRQHTFPLGAADVVVQHTPLSFDPSVWELFGPLIAGARIVVAEPGIERHPAALIELLDQHAVTTMQVVPSALEVLLEQPGLARCRDLRRVLCGGEPLTVELQDRFFATLGADLYHLYGPAETTIDATYWPCRPGGSTALAPIEPRVGRSERSVDRFGHPVAQAEPPIAPIGGPIANVRVHVLDEALQPVPAGVRGELYIGGAGVALGYRGLPALTAERFLPDPFGESPNGRLYRTGDLARWRPDGLLEFLGRADQQLKVRGIRVEPGEIESALVRHPAVREAGVVRPVEPGGGQLVAFVTVTDDVTTAELRGSAGRWLPSPLVPDRIEVVEALPRTASGKVDHRRLAARASTLAQEVDGRVTDRGVEGVRREGGPGDGVRADGVQGPSGRGADARGADLRVEPRDVLELRLHGIWQDLLPDRGFGITDDFFALGGHSLLMIRMVARIEQLLDREIPVPEVLRARTIEQLAQRLRSGPSAVALQPHGSRRPSFWAAPAGEGALCYVDLARSLGEERPFYALEFTDPHSARGPGDVIEELASHYVEEVRRIQPEGPYSLGGWSMGGAIAVEVARQLAEYDERVNPLLLLDPRRPGPMVDGSPERASPSRQMSPNERRAGGTGAATNGGQPAGTVEHLVVIETDGTPPRAGEAGSPWERLVPAVVVRRRHLRCDHAGLLREPHVDVVAEHVRAALEGAISAEA